jgi:hypothetical protein
MKKGIAMRFFVSVALIVLCASSDAGLVDAKGWPTTLEIHKTYSFTDAGKAEARLEILGVKGNLLYLLECHAAGYEGDPEFDYSGDFECRLKSTTGKDRYSTLLTENPKQTRDWESRGRAFVEELFGKCGDYPEYGKVRHFKLRRMRITFTFSNVVVRDNLLSKSQPAENSASLRSFRFDVEVKPDPTATSAIAQPVTYLEPPYMHPDSQTDRRRVCDVVKKIN